MTLTKPRARARLLADRQTDRPTDRPLVLAELPLPPWVYIASELTDGTSTQYVLNVKDNRAEPDEQVILWPLQEGSLNELWQITKDGRVLSALNNQLVLSLGAPWPDGGYILIVDTEQVPTPETQLFDTKGLPGEIRNQKSKYYTTVEGGTNEPVKPVPGLSVLSAPGKSNPSYKWRLVPGFPLDKIISQKPMPFPPFEGDRAKAYAYVNTQLSISDLRSEYLNLAAPISSYQAQINSMSPPSGVATKDWEAVIHQLNKEMTAVIGVRQLFEQYEIYHTALFADDGARLNQLGTDVGLEKGSKTNIVGLLLGIFQQVLETALSQIPVIGWVLSSVFTTAVRVGLSAENVKTTINPDPFLVAYAALWESLSTNFETVLLAMGLMEQQILSDFGMLMATYQDIVSSGPDSLSWPASMTEKLINASVAGYEVAVLQMLMPAKYQIYRREDSNDKPVSGIPHDAQWVQPAGPEKWIKHWIGDIHNHKVFPIKMQDDVWNNGVTKADFFLAARGWNFPIAWMWPCDYLAITIANQTSNVLYVQGTVKQGDYSGPSKFTLAQQQSITMMARYSFGLEVLMEVFDPNDRDRRPVASFTAHQHACVAEGGKVWVDGTSTRGKYVLASPITNTGSVTSKVSGAAQVTIYPIA